MAERQASTTHRWADRVLVALFLLVICLPTADQVLRLDHTRPPEEKRVLAPLPKLQFTTIAELPRSWESYYNDHFGFRNRLVRLYNFLMVFWLHTSPSPQIVLGRHGFLFYAGDDAVDYYRGVRPFTHEDLVYRQRILEERRYWLARRGIRFLVVVAPSKETIYPEYMPRQLNRVSRESRLDQLLRHLAANSNVEVLDLRGPLREGKRRMQVYDSTDSHWGGYGAFIAYHEIMSRVARWYPEAKPLPLSAFQLTRCVGAGDLSREIGLEQFLQGEHIRVTPRASRPARKRNPYPPIRLPDGWKLMPMVEERPGAGLPRAVMFRDSFAVSLIPLLSEHFRRITYLTEYRLDVLAIEFEHPDVVILEIAERRLMLPDTFPSNAPVVRRAGEK